MEEGIETINPKTTHFVVYYPDGKIVKGKDLHTHGWEEIPNGLSKLEYELSTGKTIELPSSKAYLSIVETSAGRGGIKKFHSITVNCLQEDELLVYRIILRREKDSPLRIGDIIIGREPVPDTLKGSWKHTG